MSPVFSQKRLFSGLGAGAFGLVIVSLGGWWFTIAVGVIVHMALLEFFRMAQSTGIRPATKTTLVACQLLLICTQWGAQGGLPSDLSVAIFPLFGAAICGWLLLQPIPGSISDIATSIFGFFYLGFLPSHWIRLRNLTDIDFSPGLNLLPVELWGLITPGMAITFASCLMIVASDIGSYELGRRYGLHRLSAISPQKTIEGALGGLFCSIIVGSVSAELFHWNFGIFIGALLGALIALFALVGDLTESMMKRNAGVKDSGDAIPGHGGILDRIDSYLFTPAVAYYSVTLIIPFLNR